MKHILLFEDFYEDNRRFGHDEISDEEMEDEIRFKKQIEEEWRRQEEDEEAESAEDEGGELPF